MLEFVGYVRSAENFECGYHPGHKVFHEMIYPSRPSSQVPLQARSHHSPPESWTITHRVISIADTQNALLNQIHNFFVEGDLESIADVTW